MARIIAPIVYGALLLCCGGARAQDAAISDIYDYVESRKADVYESVRTDYEQAVRDNPGDVVVALRLCDAIEFFSYSEAFYFENALSAAGKCWEQVREQYGAHIEILIRELQHRYDPNVISDIRMLVENSGNSYNNSQMSRLYLKLYEHQMFVQEDSGAAGAACLRALMHDNAANCRLPVADLLHELGQTHDAIAVLDSPIDPNQDPYYRVQKIQKLADFEAYDAVARQFAQFGDDELNDQLRVQVSGPLATAGLGDAALAMLGGVSEEYWNKAQLLQAQFDVALTLGDFDAAHGYYYERRKLGYSNDPLLRQRFELAGADFSLGWRPVDLIGLGALMAMFGTVALIGMIVPTGVHYRGLVRKNRRLAAGLSSSTWTLRHGTCVLVAILLLEVLSIYIFEYDLFFASFFGEYWEEPNWLNADLGRLLLINVLALAVLLTPLVLFNGRWRQLGPGDWSILKCFGVGIGLAVVLRFLLFIAIAIHPELFGFGETLLTPEAIREIYVTYGFLIVLLVTSVIVPLLEEVSFRGILLQGFSRHVTGAAANVLQSALFAGLHENLLLFPFFLVFALIAGAITRNAGGLLPAIIMHATFNAIAVASLVAIVGQ